MSFENLISGKPRLLPRMWKRATWTWMMTEASGDTQHQEHTTDLENLEQRRGSLPLAQLQKEESDFFDLIERGNVDAIERFLNEHRSLNINCINYKGLSALHIAIKKEYLAVVQVLFRRTDLEIKDAALHAVATGNTDLAEAILDAITKINPGSEMRSYDESPDYGADVTPLILAAQLDDYLMVSMLMKRGHQIEKPHIPSCLCPRCKEIMREAGSMAATFRLNRYKAICSPSYIVHVATDPIYYAFVLDRELKQCALTDKEIRTEYMELAQQVRDFTVKLISHCRNTTEIETLLKLPWNYKGTHERIEFPRLQVALDFKQKEFVAFPMVQQVLSSYWLGDFIKWPRLHFYQKCLHVIVRTILLPFICIAVLYLPNLGPIKKFQAPINRYLLSLASYIVFLLFVFLLNFLDRGNFTRGPPKTGFEALVVLFVFGNIFATFRQFWIEGYKRFLCVPWHWYDMLVESLYVVIFILWLKSLVDVNADLMNKKKAEERKFWNKYDAALLHEGLFAIATVLSFGKLAYYCLQSSRLGAFQVSMGKMLTQIAYFLIFCFLVIASFSIPMARSYAYYTGMTQTGKDGVTRSQLPSFSTFSHSFSTFFWAMFCMSPVESTDVVVENLVKDKSNPVINSHDFTETVGIALFGTYHLIMVIALLNTLIAILSNTFQKVIRCCYIKYDREPEVDVKSYEVLIANLIQRYFRAKEEEE